ncbi:(hypo)xanthine hydroxylase reductase [Enterobacter cloacae]|uniref:(Hypo)xanthine hydroxylase reductase n=1 Tax=Enterobacter cloacae TaxID=550 RepID=A0A377M364_ENTCL|nr:(hypo)xanthine hydroxylase reductase [Enterobacter cloacae]
MSDILSVIGPTGCGVREQKPRRQAGGGNGEALPEWQPGAHIDVHLPCG